MGTAWQLGSAACRGYKYTRRIIINYGLRISWLRWIFNGRTTKVQWTQAKCKLHKLLLNQCIIDLFFSSIAYASFDRMVHLRRCRFLYLRQLERSYKDLQANSLWETRSVNCASSSNVGTWVRKNIIETFNPYSKPTWWCRTRTSILGATIADPKDAAGANGIHGTGQHCRRWTRG